MIHPRAQSIIDRYFKAIDMLMASKSIKLNDFYGYWEVNKGSMHNTKMGRQEKIPLQLIYALVTDYNVSADWLITGRGGMFARQPAPHASQRQHANSPA